MIDLRGLRLQWLVAGAGPCQTGCAKILDSMKLRRVFPTVAVGLALCASVSQSAALTLGRLNGAVFIGQAIDVKVPVQWDAADTVDVSCFTAEVLHADTPQDSSKITLQLETAAGVASPSAFLRIQSLSLVDEPVVTVTVRGGCVSKTQRRYVLLADIASSVVGAPAFVAPASPPVRSVKSRDGAGAGEATPPRSQARSARTAQEGTVLVSPETKVPAVVKTPLAKPSVAPERSVARAPAPADRTRGKPRLKLDVLDLAVDYDPVLRASSEMLSVPSEDPEKRALAQLWWKQLNASPEDLLHEAAQVQQLSKELKALRDLTAQNQKGMSDLQTRLQRAQDERYANPLVYGLLGALLLTVGAWFWSWRRAASARQHWSEGLAQPEDYPSSELHDQDSVLVPVAELAELAGPAETPVESSPGVDIDLDLGTTASSAAAEPVTGGQAVKSKAQPAPEDVNVDEVSPKLLRTHDARAARHKDFQNSVSTVMRSIDSEEVIDVREQAEFFMTLGQHDKAIEVLTSRIAQCGESSPLVCLDLLRILHGLGRKADYEFMRSEFHIWFTGRVPAFGHFDETGRSLESYPHILKRIVALWPGTRAMEFIEDCLFHQEGEVDGVQFDMEAYRELLLLHAIAKRMVRMTDSVVASEPIRVPPRAKTVPERGDAAHVAPRAVTHRAGAHLRGSWMRHDTAGVSEVDPQAEIDTRGTPLSAMQVPPTLANIEPQPEVQPSLDVNLDSANGPLTNFEFLNVRRS